MISLCLRTKAGEESASPGLSSGRVWSPVLILSVFAANCAVYWGGVSQSNARSGLTSL